VGRGGTYYWAQDEKVPLHDTSLVAVDVPAAKRARLWDGELEDVAAGAGARRAEDLLLVPAAELPAELHDRLREAGAVQPVLGHDDTLLVVLPEVRVEAGDADTAAAVSSAVRDSGVDVAVEERVPGRFVLRPRSGRGEDALELANHVYERARPDASQARFLRVVTGKDPPDPGPG
jgi:hypothetical protein